MALILPFYVRRPSHPLGNFSLLASQRRVPADTTGTRLWLPSDLGSKLQMWLKGDDLSGANGSSITTWTDATANANNAIGTTNKPTLVTAGLNGMNTAAFAGASSQCFFLPSTLLSGRTQSASFAVYKLTVDPPASGTTRCGPVFGDFGTSASGNHDPFQDGSFYDDYCSTTRRTVTGVSSSTSFRILGLRSKAADWRLDINGTNAFTDSTNTVGVNTAPTLGFTTDAGHYLDGQMAEVVDCNDFLTTAEKEQVEGYLAWKWGLQASLPVGHTYAAAAPRIATVASHDATGVLTGPGSTIVGTAVYNAVHPTSGALTGPGSTIVGSAARTREHTTTGVLTGTGSTIVGVAVFNAAHATSGALTGAGSTIVGPAARTREHATTGVLTGPGSTVVGAAVYNAKHATSGTLTGPGSTVVGSAARFRAFAATGVLVGPGSAIAGSADHASSITSHATSGALFGQSSTITTAAARTREHVASGILIGSAAFIDGSAARWRDHGSSGVLLGVTSVVFGRVFNGTPELQDIPVDSENLVNEPVPATGMLGSITEPGGQIVNASLPPAADLA